VLSVEQGYLVLNWKGMGVHQSFAQHLSVKNLDGFCNVLVGTLSKLGATTTSEKPHVIKEEEVSPANVRRTEIEVILDAIAIYEASF
jgi:hypothetical protein